MPMILESNQNHATAKDSEVVNALPASMGMGGGYVPMVVEPIVFTNDTWMKINEKGGIAYSLLERDHKDPQCVVIEDAESNRNA